jgi:RecA/RadA recombinase
MHQDNVQIIIKGEDKTHSITKYAENNGRIDITYSDGKVYSYDTKNVQIKHFALINDTISNRFEYLKRIAECTGLKDPDGGNILLNQYNKIRFSSEESMLSAFLLGKLQSEKQTNTVDFVYPFGFNESQKTAIDNGLKNPLTIIEGPPGTGKTQTILNIIANAVMRNESVAVVSNNNSATKNVKEKLQQYQVDFIAAYLGSSENKAKFIESQKPLPDMAAWNISLEERKEIDQSLHNLYGTLSTMLAKKNELSQIQQELDALELEYKHFCEYSSYGKEHTLYLKPSITSTKALELWLFCEKYAEREKMPGFFGRLINRLLRGVISKEFYSSGHDKMIEICQSRWYTARIFEVKTRTMLLQAELDRFNFDEKMTEYTTLSGQLFRNYLAKKYTSKERRRFELNDLRKNSKAFIQTYPVILSTAYSLRNSLSQMVVYDYVIIDESSQVDLATGALVLSCAKKAVIVGDLKQLPNVVDGETALKTDKIFADFNLPEVFRYRNHSLLLAVSELFPETPQTLLREHYRCHPKIINFCNQKFYNNQLIILTDAKSDRQPLMVYKTVPGNHARDDHTNQRQIDVIAGEIIPQQNLDNDTVSIGIVTPYRNQAIALQNTFADTGIQADTADKFQGREKKVIIFSTVDNQISKFADDANRLNVAVSRAIKQLIVVINSDTDIRNTNIGDLVRYIEYNNLSIIQSEIQSVFDYLYKSYREKRNAVLRKQKRISEYDSENLMYGLIRNVLDDERFIRFDVAVHVPVKLIIRDMSKLDADEKRYAQNIATHVDFLIFDKIGKVPRLVVEVDGTAFHRKGTKQAERDKKKNNILEKYELPYIRFRTDESGEHEKLINILGNMVT